MQVSACAHMPVNEKKEKGTKKRERQFLYSGAMIEREREKERDDDNNNNNGDGEGDGEGVMMRTKTTAKVRDGSKAIGW